MKYETPCPICRRPVSLWTIMGATTPSRIKCKHCGYFLSIRKEDWSYVIGSFVLGAIVGFAIGYYLMGMYLNRHLACTTSILVFAIIVIPFVFIVAFAFSAMICTRSWLVPAERYL